MLARNKSVLGTLVGFLVLLLVSFSSKADVVLVVVTHTGNTELAFVPTTDVPGDRDLFLSNLNVSPGANLDSRNNIWTYQFPGYENAKVDGLVLLMANPKTKVMGIDLEEEHSGVRLVYDTERAINGTIDMSQLIGEAYLWERIPSDVRFVWVGYTSNHNGTFVTAITPAMNPEQLLGSLANESEKGENAIAICDNGSGINQYVKQ